MQVIKLYHHVTGRPPSARTLQTDDNMRFYLRYQKRSSREQIQDFMQSVPPANFAGPPDKPWGSVFMTPNGLLPGTFDNGEGGGGDDLGGGGDDDLGLGGGGDDLGGTGDDLGGGGDDLGGGGHFEQQPGPVIEEDDSDDEEESDDSDDEEENAQKKKRKSSRRKSRGKFISRRTKRKAFTSALEKIRGPKRKLLFLQMMFGR